MENSDIRIRIGTHDYGADACEYIHGSRDHGDSKRIVHHVHHVFKAISGSGNRVCKRIAIRRGSVSDVQEKQGSNGLVQRHHQGADTSVNRLSYRYASGVYRHPAIRRFKLVCLSALSLTKKVAVPFAAITTVSLFAGFERAEASGVLSKTWDFGKEFSQFYNDFKSFDFIQYLTQHLYHWSIEIMAWVYKMLNNFVLHTPLWLFKHSAFEGVTLTLSMLSVSLVILFSMYEGIMRMLSIRSKKKDYTKMDKIAKRFFIALLAAGLMPTLFVKGFTVLNWLSHTIGQIGYINMTAKVNPGNISGLDVLALGLFDVALIGYLIPVLLKNGRRFFDLICLNILSPLALTAWVFERHRNLYHQWWSAIKNLAVVQVVHSLFIGLLGILIFAIPNTFNGGALFFKMILVVGGLARMNTPPRILSHYQSDFGGTVKDTYKGFLQSLNLKKKIPILNKLKFKKKK